MVEDGYAKIRSPWNSTTRSARDQAPSRRDVDRLLEDQFDSHLSPLRTGIGSRSFRLRAVRTGDGDRRLAGVLRSVRFSGGCTARGLGRTLQYRRPIRRL